MYLYGASGHGKVIKEIIESQGEKITGFIDDNESINIFAGLPVIHSITKIVDELIISIGINKTRKAIVEKVLCNCLSKFAEAVFHKNAIISDSASLGIGTVVMGGAIINADSRIGKHCIVNTGASIDHDCIINDYVHISPHATLCGNVTIGEGSWIGAGSTVIQGVTIGRWSLIGAGSVVTKDVPDGYMAVGNRCKLVKKINQEMI